MISVRSGRAPLEGGVPRSPTAGLASVPAGSSAHTLTVGGRQRTFRIYRPASAPSPAPLVVMSHGGLVSDGCCGPGVRTAVNDVASITQLVAAVSRAMPIDQARTYATGISNGGMPVYRLACDTAIFAAIGPDSATQLGSCPRPAPISLIHIHGTADRTVPYTGGPGRRDNGGQGRIPVDINGPPVPDLIARSRELDHCATPSTSQAPPVTTSTATCPDGRAVELVTIDGAGHQWPGVPAPAHHLVHLAPPSPALNATDTIWRFFLTHPPAGCLAHAAPSPPNRVGYASSWLRWA